MSNISLKNETGWLSKMDLQKIQDIMKQKIPQLIANRENIENIIIDDYKIDYSIYVNALNDNNEQTTEGVIEPMNELVIPQEKTNTHFDFYGENNLYGSINNDEEEALEDPFDDIDEQYPVDDEKVKKKLISILNIF